MKPPFLWYFANPMCSWCRGFSPVIESVRTAIDACLAAHDASN
ncbi:MAG TPA: hypothetical protein PLQ95_10130 [Thiobacillus sp.]|nr:hypothetical protein [Thiobacillus sp.]